jgi:hypothetical protein
VPLFPFFHAVIVISFKNLYLLNPAAKKCVATSQTDSWYNFPKRKPHVNSSTDKRFTTSSWRKLVFSLEMRLKVTPDQLSWSYFLLSIGRFPFQENEVRDHFLLQKLSKGVLFGDKFTAVCCERRKRLIISWSTKSLTRIQGICFISSFARLEKNEWMNLLLLLEKIAK